MPERYWKFRKWLRYLFDHWANFVITEKIMNHPYEYGIAWAMIFSALNLLMVVQDQLLIWLCVFTFLASLLIIVGLNWRGKRLMGLTLELYGHMFATLVWAADFVIIINLINFQLVWNLGVPLSLMIAAGFKSWRVYAEKQVYKIAYRRAATINSSREFREAG